MHSVYVVVFVVVVVVVVVDDDLHVTVNNIILAYSMLHNSAFTLNLCRQEQCKLYVQVFEKIYLSTNLQSFHKLRVNGALKQKNVRLFMALDVHFG
jgi:hypothetical protein